MEDKCINYLKSKDFKYNDAKKSIVKSWFLLIGEFEASIILLKSTTSLSYKDVVANNF
jgi:hypothetical protein